MISFVINNADKRKNETFALVSIYNAHKGPCGKLFFGNFLIGATKLTDYCTQHCLAKQKHFLILIPIKQVSEAFLATSYPVSIEVKHNKANDDIHEPLLHKK